MKTSLRTLSAAALISLASLSMSSALADTDADLLVIAPKHAVKVTEDSTPNVLSITMKGTPASSAQRAKESNKTTQKVVEQNKRATRAAN